MFKTKYEILMINFHVRKPLIQNADKTQMNINLNNWLNWTSLANNSKMITKCLTTNWFNMLHNIKQLTLCAKPRVPTLWYDTTIWWNVKCYYVSMFKSCKPLIRNPSWLVIYQAFWTQLRTPDWDHCGATLYSVVANRTKLLCFWQKFNPTIHDYDTQ